jgi:hypothetical protein
MFDDGDHLSIALRRTPSGWELSDEGTTFMRLTYSLEERNLNTGTRQRIIANALEWFGIRDNSGELVLQIPANEFGNALYSFIQAILKISDVTFLSRERVHSAFLEDFESFIETRVPPERRQFRWHHPQLDPEAMYPVDCLVTDGTKPLMLFALNSDSKVRDSTITLLKFEQWAIKGPTVGVFENQEEINRTVLARFTDVVDRQFSSLAVNKERIETFLSEFLKGGA